MPVASASVGVPGRPLPSSGTEAVARPGPLAQQPPQGRLPGFFPGLFNQGQGESDRLARAKAPEFYQTASREAARTSLPPESVRPTGPVEPTRSADAAVTETAAEVEADSEIPTLPVAMRVQAYPLKPSPTLPPTQPDPKPTAEPKDDRPPFEAAGLTSAPPREPPAAAPAPDRQPSQAPASALLAIPGLEDAPAAVPARAESTEPAPAGRPRRDPSETQAAPSPKPTNERFRVAPRPGAAPAPEPAATPWRGPISRWIRKMKAENGN